MSCRTAGGVFFRFCVLSAWIAAVDWVLTTSVQAANPAGDLRIQVIAAYNFVVDSNVESPSTYAPRSAYIGATFYNDGANALSNVVAYVGNYNGGSNPTPGIYPSRTHAPLVGPLPGDKFALTHEGGSIGVDDATRVMGTIPAGGSVTAYWLVSYPNVDKNGDAVWGPSVKPDDDLWLNFDIWATATDAGSPVTADQRKKVTMRNEISAMANKISPNSANKVPQEYQDLLKLYAPSWTNSATDGSPGSSFLTEGVWYDFGTVNQGFDNNGDLVPDYNAWMQPVGDPSVFDSSCFRLVKTRALVVAKRSGGNPDTVIVTENQLYFENLPSDNIGVVGYVAYEFMPLRGGCSSSLSPYQEVASGNDNEKFNGDFGATLGGLLVSIASSVDMTKSVNRTRATPGTKLSYTVAFTNDGTATVGKPSEGVPLVISDTIPVGTAYVAGSAAASNTLPVGVTAYTIYYSTNSGTSWSLAEPVPASKVTDIEWWLNGPFDPGRAGSVKFQVTVNNPFPVGLPEVENTAAMSFGRTTPFHESDAVTYLLGTNNLSGTVFLDNGTGLQFGDGIKNGAEGGISSILLTLYYDTNGNGAYDSGDVTFATTNSAAGTGAYTFKNLPDGRYLVAVNSTDSDMPKGVSPTTVLILAAALDPGRTDANPVNVIGLDFGFVPALVLTKSGSASIREGTTTTYTMIVSNRFVGNGTSGGYPVTFSRWATAGNANTWLTPANAYDSTAPDGDRATTQFGASSSDVLTMRGYGSGSTTGNIAKVELEFELYKTGSFRTGDRVQLRLFVGNTQVWIYTNPVNAFASGTFRTNVTYLRTWTWSDFATVSNRVDTTKGTQSSGGGTFGVDQSGFRITSDVVLGAADNDNTLNPAPLYDYFNTNYLQFVSASPAQTSVDTNGPAPDRGRLYWSNVGPIYPGGKATVTATFRVREPSGNVARPTTNTAVVTGATYGNGMPANNATSKVTSTVSPAGSIGDFVWRDLDSDGVQDGGNETGIAGVTVTCTPPAGVDLGNGAGVAVSTVTDASGYYLFTGLPATGSYTISVTASTLPGGSGTCTKDRDATANGTTAVSITYDSTTGGDKVTDADFGYVVSSIVEGTLWNDLNRNGATSIDSGENWLSGVTVQLYSGSTPSGSPLATTTTDASGYFKFTGAYNGNYCIQIVTNTGAMAGTWTQSFDTDGKTTANYVPVSVVTGGKARGDFSYYRTGAYSVGDTLFYDWDGNGTQDAIDEGLRNVTVRLYEDANGNGVVDAGVDALIAVTNTSTSGTYQFATLPTNRYTVVVDLADTDMPAQYKITYDPDSTKDARNGFNLSASRIDVDFGFQPTGVCSIGDSVWRDRNADGVQSGPLETGIANITVTLQVDFNGDGTYVNIATTTTDSSGNYLFSNLPYGTYRVVVTDTDPDLPTDAFGNRWYPTTATTRSTTLSASNLHPTNIDFGFAALGAIGDTIFWDANKNGTQDYNETGASNVIVYLYYDNDNNGVYSVGDTSAGFDVTDTSGKYLFTGLSPDDYVVVVDTAGVLSGVTLSADPDCDGVPVGSPPADCGNGETDIGLVPGQSFMGADFGYVPPGGVIGDRLWVDLDGNGQWEADEGGIPYITVRLYDAATNLVATTVTDGDGLYTFSGLANGTYRVAVDTADTDFPAGLAQTYDRDGTLDDKVTGIVIAGGAVTSIGGVGCTDCALSVDFGYRYVGPNALSGTVGLDGTVPDGLLNGLTPTNVAADEAAFSGVTVYAYLWHDDGDGTLESGESVLVNTALTDSRGNYAFNNLPSAGAGYYYVVSISAPTAKLDLTTTTNATSAFRLSETTDLQGYNVSAYQAFTIVASRQNADFAFVSLVDYDFGDLPDSYSTLMAGGARHVQPATPNLYLGTSVSSEDNGKPSTAATLDTFDDGVTITSRWQNADSGGTVRVRVGAGSGYLVGFIDFDNSGAFDNANELVVNQSVAYNGGPGSDGRYTFAIDVPDARISTTNTTKFYARFRLLTSEPMFSELAYQGESSNGEVEDYLWALNTISGTTYVDSDSNTSFSGGDTKQPGVIVKLYDASSNLVAQTVTDLNGFYSFYGLLDGSYSVVMTAPSGTTAILDADGAGNGHRKIEMTLAGASALNRNFLLSTGGSTANISGTVYDDGGLGAAGNGAFGGSGDIGVAGVSVSVYRDLDADGVADADELVGTQTTDSSGNYLFSKLPDANYLVVMATPVGATAITDADGAGNGKTLIAVTLAGTNITTRDFLVDGMQSPAAIGNWVWFDSDGDGIQDAGETNGIANVPVSLLNVSGSVTSVVASTSTDASGYYRFENVQPGSYIVRWDLRDVTGSNVRIADANRGADDAKDSDGVTGSTAGYVKTASFNITSGTTNLTVDLGLTYDVVTRAAVADVRGEWRGKAGYVVWQTSSEWGTAGFNVYRIDPLTGEETRINGTLIPSTFSPVGDRRYEWVDPLAEEGGRGLYRLAEKELHGETLDLGTHEVTFLAPPPVARSVRAVVPVAAPAPVAPVVPSECLKVMFREEGIYGVSYAALAAGLGLAEQDVAALAASGGLDLSAQGKPLAYTADAAGARLLFYGRKVDTLYTRDAAVLIRRGAGQRMARREPGAAESGVSTLDVQRHFEQDNYIFDSLGTPVNDLFYWDYVVSGNPVSGSRDFPIDLAGYTGGTLTLTVRLIGMSFTPGDPDHVAEILLNGALLETVRIQGQDVSETVITVPAGQARAGVNTLTVRGTLPATSGSFFALDWIDAYFGRTLTPAAGTLTFTSGGAAAIDAQTFEHPVALSISGAAPALIAAADGTLADRAWATAAIGERFALAESALIPMLAPQSAAADAWFMNDANRVDYLIVVSREMEPAVRELAAYRAAQGLRVGVAVFEDACDLLADGLRTPEAVRSLLRRAAARWAAAPWMVLLAGNGNYDYNNALGVESNPLPPLLYRNERGIFAADGLFGDLDGDGLPESAVGRLPARNAADLSVMIAKIKAYEAEYDATWQQRLALVADTREDGADFRSDSEGLASIATNVFELGRIYRDQLSVAEARSRLADQFSAGAGVIHYAGHGNPSIMGRTSSAALLRAGDVEALANARQPLLVTLSCLVGRYEAPGNDSLGELLLRRDGGGAVAVWGPSGLSSHHNAIQLGEAFLKILRDRGAGALGPAALRARLALAGADSAFDTLVTYNLLGDPALKMGGLRSEAALGTLGTAQWRFERFSPSELVDPRISHAIGESGRLTQTLAFEPIPDRTAIDTVVLSAEASSGLDVVFDVLSGPGRIAGDRLYFTTAGEVTVAAAQPGNEFWEAAPQAVHVTRVQKASAVVQLANLAQTANGAAHRVAATTVPDGLRVTLTYNGSAIAPIVAGSYAVQALIDDPLYAGTAEATLHVVPALPRTGVDLDCDGMDDVVVFNPASAAWSGVLSTDGRQSAVWGRPGALPVPGDYDADGIGDAALYDPATGDWLIRLSAGGGVRQVNFGIRETVPVPADYDGDGVCDIAVCHPPSGLWFIRESGAGNHVRQQPWDPALSVPVPADYDGDGLADIAVYHAQSGQWRIQPSNGGATRQVFWGRFDAAPVPADYDGDGCADIAVYHAQSGQWFASLSAGGPTLRVTWGRSDAVPVPADYDGDGRADIAVYHAQSGQWFIRGSDSGELLRKQSGGANAVPALRQSTINRWFGLE